MTVDGLIIAIGIIIVALAFVALVIFLGVTLLSLRRTIADVDDKIQAFDPLFRVVSKTGEVVEQKAQRSLEHAQQREREIRDEVSDQKERALNTAVEIAQWTLMGVAIWQKFRERK